MHSFHGNPAWFVFVMFLRLYFCSVYFDKMEVLGRLSNKTIGILKFRIVVFFK